MLTAIERLLLTLWVGSLWSIGYLAVPILFASLDDRVLAGRLAGSMFSWVSYIGLVSGGLLLARVAAEQGARAWRAWVLSAMLGLVVIGEFIIQPQMAALKVVGLAAGGEAAARFATLHGVASTLYLVVSLLGAGLVAAGLRAAGGGASGRGGK